VYIHGGVLFESVEPDTACEAKSLERSRTALFLVDTPEGDIDLALCSGASRGKSDPYLLGTKKVNAPDMMVTTQTYPVSPLCKKAATNQGEVERLKGLLRLWNNYDNYCMEEFGNDYKAARAQEALFYLDGRKPVLAKGTVLAGHNIAVTANVRGGYIWWASAANNFANVQPQSYHIPWTLGVIYSDCFSGFSEGALQEEHRQTKKGQFCSAPTLFESGDLTSVNKVPGYAPTGRENNRAPILCRRAEAPIKMTSSFGIRDNLGGYITPHHSSPSCASVFGQQYTPMIAPQLQTEAKSAFLDIQGLGTGTVSTGDIMVHLGSMGVSSSEFYLLLQDPSGLLSATQDTAMCGLAQTLICQNKVFNTQLTWSP